MAYRLKPRESVRAGVKRIAREELDDAIQSLRREDRGPAVHETRKHLKKLRALLRLVRGSMNGARRSENARLRDIGKKLSPVRDAEALIEAVDRLHGRYPALRTMRRALVRHEKEVERDAGIDTLAPKLARALESTRNGVRSWHVDGSGFDALEPGLKSAFRRGRKALQLYLQTGERQDLHEWRKRVKDHWYHVRLLQDLWHDGMQEYERALKQLEDALGEHLNLSLLKERAAGAEEATHEIEDEQRRLLQLAMEIGDRVYREKPKQVVKRLRLACHA
jgi:CHAD domain-containing protein